MGQTQRVSKANTKFRKENYDDTVVQLYDTDIVRWNKKTIVLCHDGFTTATTKNRMNQVSNEYNLGYNVYQKQGNWFVTFKGETFEFSDASVTLVR